MVVAMINRENIVEDDNFIIKSYSPKNFLNDFIKKTSNFQNGHQDNFELLRILLNDISLEIIEISLLIICGIILYLCHCRLNHQILLEQKRFMDLRHLKYF